MVQHWHRLVGPWRKAHRVHALGPKLFIATIAIVTVLLVLPQSELLAAENVQLRTGMHDGYGRLVFDWPREVGYRVTADGNRLIIEFDRPGEFNLEAKNRLPSHIRDARAAADGTNIQIDLQAAFHLKHFSLGKRIVLDLSERPTIPEATGNAGKTKSADASSTKPSQPERAAPALTNEPASATAAPPIGVRGGAHKGFSRLVFDWPLPPQYSVEPGPEHITIRFATEGRLDLRRLDLAALPQILAADVRMDGENAALRLSVQPGSNPRHFRLAEKVILDVLDQTAEVTPSSSKASSPQKASPQAVPVKPVTQKKLPPVPLRADRSTVPPPAQLLPPQATTSLAPDSPAPIPVSPPPTLAKPAPAKPAPATPAPATPAPRPLTGVDRAGATIDPSSVDGSILEEYILEDVTAPTITFNRRTSKASDLVSADNSNTPLVATPPIGRQAPASTPAVLRFAWAAGGAAAAFQRGNFIWLIFDRPAPPGLLQQLRRSAPQLGRVQRLRLAAGTALRVQPGPTWAARLTHDQGGWTVDLRPRSKRPIKPMTPKIESHATGAAGVHFPVPVTGKPIRIRDPDMGNSLVVIPVQTPGLGLATTQEYPLFRALASQQGLIIEPLSDTLSIQTGPKSVEVTSGARAMLASAEQEREQSPSRSQKGGLPNLLQLPTAMPNDGDAFSERKQALLHALANAVGPAQDLARLDLARFYFAHAMTAEALGILKLIEERQPRLARDPEVVLLRGASHFLRDDFEEAAKELSEPAVAGEPEARLWQAALAAARHDWEVAAEAFTEAESLIDAYPHPVQIRLRLLAAEASLELGDDGTASRHLRRIEETATTASERAQITFLRGWRQHIAGDTVGSTVRWKDAAKAKHHPTRARARLALIDIGLADGSLSPETAIEMLERLQFAWRGDAFEFVLLQQLGKLYIDEGHYRKGLRTWRELVSGFPNAAETPQVASAMQMVFANLFLGDDADDLPPIKALAIHDEFAELAPVGEDGDRLALALAERLIAVDLLDRAALELQRLVEFRLQGNQKAAAGARLAEVHLMDMAPDRAIAALLDSRVADLPQELQHHRDHIQARALMRLDRLDDALSLLSDDRSQEGIALRASLLWKKEDWQGAAENLGQLIPKPAPKRGELPEEDARNIVNLAVALTLAGDREALGRLAKDYADVLPEGVKQDSLALLAGAEAGKRARTIAEELQQVGDFEAFMKSYRENSL